MTDLRVDKVIKNHWCWDDGEGVRRALVLSHEHAPEGLDFERIHFVHRTSIEATAEHGQLLSMVRGRGTLRFGHDEERPLAMEGGVHLYLPPETEVELEAEPGTEIVRAVSPSRAQARGSRILVRDEAFVAACAARMVSLRWIFTPQYLSRRIFLHHDEALLSRAGHPVSWFHTTMFDVAGLPPNEDGESVFKMAYNTRTEINVCYEVEGRARVRYAIHPYAARGQAWTPWIPLDGDSSYRLNEVSGGPEEERHLDELTGERTVQKNKHEIGCEHGWVSLLCMFDPSPTGVERHRPGEYSDYEPLAAVMERPEYHVHQREIRAFDEMVDVLSLAKARGVLDAERGTPLWARYLEGRAMQTAIESELLAASVAEGRGREKILERWLSPKLAI